MDAKELYERFKGKACKRFPKDAKKKELKEAHRIKMELKETMRKRRPEPIKPHILANISKHHPDYGETMQENMSRMLQKSS